MLYAVGGRRDAESLGKPRGRRRAEKDAEKGRIREIIGAQYVEEQDEYGKLHYEGQASRRRVYFVFLVETHRLLIHFFPVVSVFFLDHLQHRLYLLHMLHREHLLLIERVKSDPHRYCEQYDRQSVRMRDPIKELEYREKELARSIPYRAQNLHRTFRSLLRL